MILIGLGSNLTGRQFGSPRAVLEAALEKMAAHDIEILEISRFYQSEPVPKSDQPWFVNAVASVKSALAPAALLAELHAIETALGRERRVRWEARIIDLDLLAYEDQILPSKLRWRELSAGGGKEASDGEMVVPHPRLHERLFALLPLMDVAPDWRHPALCESVADLVERVKKQPAQGAIRPLSRGER